MNDGKKLELELVINSFMRSDALPLSEMAFKALEPYISCCKEVEDLLSLYEHIPHLYLRTNVNYACIEFSICNAITPVCDGISAEDNSIIAKYVYITPAHKKYVDSLGEDEDE